MRNVALGLTALLALALGAAPCFGQGSLGGVGGGPSTSFLRDLPSYGINRTLGGSMQYTTARDFARATPPQQASYLAARGIVTSLRGSALARGGFRALAPGMKPSGMTPVRSIDSFDFEQRRRFARMKETVLALAERAREKEELRSLLHEPPRATADSP